MNRFDVGIVMSTLAVLYGCQGTIGGTPNDPNVRLDGGPGFDSGYSEAPDVYVPGHGRAPPTCDDGVCLGASQMPVLTALEYENSINELFPGLDYVVTDAPPDFLPGDFENNAGVRIDDTRMSSYRTTAEDVARLATGDLDALFEAGAGCTRADDGCSARYIESFLRRAHRRPDAERLERYGMLFELGENAQAGIQMVIEAALQSPYFLNRVELERSDVVEGGEHALDAYELAARLSFLFWRSTPNDELLDAAESGELDDAEGIARHARRLLDDSRSDTSLETFHAQWLALERLDGTERSTVVFPEYSGELLADFRRETALFTQALYRGDGETYETLLNADFSFLNARLARFYGVDEPAESGFSRVTLPAGRRGILTQGAVLTANAKEDAAAAEKPEGMRPTLGANSPILRGLMVRTRLLCHGIGEPPDGADFSQPDLDPTGATSRQLLEERTDGPGCRGCHSAINPPGFAFQNYDALGRYRETENMQPIDASGLLLHELDNGEAFDDLFGLLDILSGRADAQYCAVRQWFRYAMARDEDADDEAAIYDTYERFEASGGNLRELVIALVDADAFRYRRVASCGDRVCEVGEDHASCEVDCP